MATSVVHHRQAGQKTDPDHEYIGRPSKWGNPFEVKEYGLAKCIDLHKQWLVTQTELLVAIVNGELSDKILVCYCAPKACHGDTLADCANLISQCPLDMPLDRKYDRLVLMLTS